MTDPSEDLRQWLPVTWPPTLALPPEDAEGGYQHAAREALKAEIGAAWDDFAGRGFAELAAMEEHMQRRVEALGEERRQITVPPKEPGPNRFSDHTSEEQWADFCDRDRRAKLRKRREALATRNQLKFRLGVLRNVLHRQTVFGDESRSWGEVPPEGKEEMAQAGLEGAAHDRTVSIGRALIQYRKQNEGELPYTYDGQPFGGKLGTLYEWAADAIDDASESTARRALADTSCLPPGNQGSSGDRVAEAVSRAVQYAERFSDGA